ncbi:hypothetical protein GWI33_021413 [Rhynchophorus ferrugineus]|uniref:Uncharacterized protein n=1 Tax=Rhynchophorus ferrugineus TaxID=354439 RepID=A0A834HPK7_RHYFE|nr:hypothetical protein GWI33_021415 [Rhynchophorus ferrugineus]KAF7265146.1 hypothetical protein GWI33_021413 [Rhynchophorus ferrugineus]
MSKNRRPIRMSNWVQTRTPSRLFELCGSRQRETLNNMRRGSRVSPGMDNEMTRLTRPRDVTAFNANAIRKVSSLQSLLEMGRADISHWSKAERYSV